MNLDYFDAIVINSSGGKDSQTALRYVALEAEEQGFPSCRISVSHQDLGTIEWQGTRSLAREQAEHYGFKFHLSKRRTKDGEEIDLLEGVRRRGKWPDYKNRYCTSDYKRGPGSRVLTAIAKNLRNQGIKRPKILQVFGLRAEESRDREKKPVFHRNRSLSNGVRLVYDWHPIKYWSTADVWRDIHRSGVRYHAAYDAGMSRLSCVFCVFASQRDLLIAGTHNKTLLNRYVEVEREIGHTFKKDMPIEHIRNLIHKEVA